MQHYQSHKVVKAGKILGFNAGVRVEDDKGILERFAVRFQVDNGIEGSPPELVDAPMDVFARGRCEIGDYLVRYEDGYMAWSPADVFEDGYRAVEVAQSIDMNQWEFERKYPDTESLIEDQWPPEGHPLLSDDIETVRPGRQIPATGPMIDLESTKNISDGPIPDPKQAPENDIFTRGAMCQIRDDAKAKVYDENNDMHSGVDLNWIRAWFDLMMAADRLDAMIARSESVPCEEESPASKLINPIAIKVNAARQGGERSVISLEYDGVDASVFTDIAADVLVKYQPGSITVDEIGIGAGVSAGLRRYGYDVNAA